MNKTSREAPMDKPATSDGTTREGTRSHEEALEATVFADAVLNLAGHVVTDPYLNELHYQAARGIITGDQERALILAHIRDGGTPGA